MEDQFKSLQTEVNVAVERLRVHDLNAELTGLKAISVSPQFWDNTNHARDVMKQISKLEARTIPWVKLESGLNDFVELSGANDPGLEADLFAQFKLYQLEFAVLKQELKFSEPYDSHEAIISIYAGAGGTDAQDWTQMLFRMYSRYFANNRWNITLIDQSAGDEAGLKSITLEVEGSFAYGKLKSEHGVHRLVRLSPFNADNLRQTSFAKVEVMPKIDRQDDLIIDDKDLKIDVYRSGGSGGQSVNTTDSAVRVTHLPTGITIAIQNERSQLQNRETAMTILRSKLAQLQIEQHQEQLSELKGPNQSAEWGNQIRSYVIHPYKQVKDLRSRYETSDPDSVLDGNLDPLINAYLEHTLSSN